MPRISIQEALQQEKQTRQPREGFDVNRFQETLEKNRVDIPEMNTQADTDPFLLNVGQGVAKSAGDTVFGLGKIGRGIQRGVSKVGDAALGRFNPLRIREGGVFDEGSESNQAAQNLLERDTAGEKIGGFAGDVAQFAVPASRVGTAARSAGLSRPATIGAQAVTSGGVATAQEGELGRESAIAAGTEAAFPVVGRLARPFVNYGKGVLKGLAGTISGTGGDVVERAFTNPSAARQGLTASDEEALKTTARTVRQGVKDLKKKAGNEYSELVSSVDINLKSKPLKDKLKQQFVEEADAVPTKDGLSFGNSPFADSEERLLQKANNVIEEWSDFSAEGVNRLATRLNRFRRGTQDAANFDRVIDQLRRTTREYVGEQVPSIREANEKFAAKMDLIDELDSILKTQGAVESRQGLRETSQRIARLFNANKELSREAVEELEKEIGVDTLAIEAGRQLSDEASMFQLGAQGDVMSLVRSFIPRRVIGEMVTRSGQTYEAAEQLLGENLSRLDATSRGVVIDMLTDLFGEE